MQGSLGEDRTSHRYKNHTNIPGPDKVQQEGWLSWAILRRFRRDMEIQQQESFREQYQKGENHIIHKKREDLQSSAGTLSDHLDGCRSN